MSIAGLFTTNGIDLGWVPTTALAVTQIIIAYITKKANDESKAEIRMLKNMQADTQLRQDRQEYEIKHNKEGHYFRKELCNDVTVTAAIKIIESEAIPARVDLSDALTSYFNQLSEFALTFFYSPLRTDARITEEFLRRFITVNFNPEFRKLDEFFKTKIKDEKCIVVGNSKKCVEFYEYLNFKFDKKPNIYDYNELLISRLVINGINEAELKKIFVTYTDNFLNEFKDKLVRFNKLKDFDIETDIKI
jgi:hypothetical protein